MTTDCILIYITTPSPEEAERIGQTLVEDRLAACANIVRGMTSFYRWEGSVERGEETILLLKTRVAQFEAVEERVKKMHANTCPCIVAFPITQGAPDFLDWIREGTAG